MIRRIKKNDIPVLKELWRICFGDTAEFIELFFRYQQPANGLCFDHNGRITSMLFILETANSNFRYIYACATLPTFRRQGQMKTLLDEAYCQASIAKKSLLLVPASYSLSRYYKKLGFKHFSNLKKVFVQTTQDQPSKIKQNDLNNRQLNKIRNSFFDTSYDIAWSNKHIALSREILQLENGDFIGFYYQGKVGYAACEPKGDELHVKELTFDISHETELQDVANFIGRIFRKKTIVFFLKTNSPLKGEYVSYALSRRIKFSTFNYFNLGLD